MKTLLHSLLLALLLFAPARATAATAYPLTVTDALGRSVTIPKPPKAILLGSGFNLVALSLIHPDPVSLLAGWAGDLKSDNPEIYESFRRKFPAIEALPLIGDGNTVSLEAALSVRADLAILANWQAENDLGRQAIGMLEQAGVPVLVVNFNTDVLRATPENIRLLGRVIDREAAADAYARFYEARIERIRARVAAHPQPGPSVLLEAFPDSGTCCYAYGAGGIGAYIALAGGRNVAEGLPSLGAQVSNEFILTADPDIYVATASPGGRYSSLSVGPGVPADAARDSLKRATAAPYLAGLRAVREGRVHGLWNFFNAVPINILAAEAFARWLQPELFADVDPAETLREINGRFAAVPFEGSYWIDMAP